MPLPYPCFMNKAVSYVLNTDKNIFLVIYTFSYISYYLKKRMSKYIYYMSDQNQLNQILAESKKKLVALNNEIEHSLNVFKKKFSFTDYYAYARNDWAQNRATLLRLVEMHDQLYQLVVNLQEFEGIKSKQ